MIAVDAQPDAVRDALHVSLGFPMPDSLRAGAPTAIFCYGTCFHPRAAIDSLELVAGADRATVRTVGMPRPDLFAALHPGFDPAAPGAADGDAGAVLDPDLRSFRSGFWETIAVTPAPGRPLELRLEARLADGTQATATLAKIAVEDPPAPPGGRPPAGGGPVAICMASFEPDPVLFERQIDSLRGQTHTDWVCVISDDHSEPAKFERIEAIIGEDPRFAVSRAGERLGFYRNFERALGMAPAEAPLIALCDQDDVWYPDKLEVLVAEMGDAELAYSDQRLVDPHGAVIAESLWTGRRNNYSNLTSLLVANSITGAAALFRREVAEAALPFPQSPGWQFHDHWIGLVALARGRIAFVDRPLYDYVQHAGAILGQVAVEAEAPPPRPSLRGRLERSLRAQLTGWRPIYFCGYLRLAVQARILLARCAGELSPRKRRELTRFARAEDSLLLTARLALRPARALAGRGETLGAEGQLVRGLLWRWLTRARLHRRRGPLALGLDAGFPPCGPDSFGQKRLRRWRGRRRS